MDIFEEKINNLLKVKRQEIVQALEDKPPKPIKITSINSNINSNINDNINSNNINSNINSNNII